MCFLGSGEATDGFVFEKAEKKLTLSRSPPPLAQPSGIGDVSRDSNGVTGSLFRFCRDDFIHGQRLQTGARDSTRDSESPTRRSTARRDQVDFAQDGIDTGQSLFCVVALALALMKPRPVVAIIYADFVTALLTMAFANLFLHHAAYAAHATVRLKNGGFFREDAGIGRKT